MNLRKFAFAILVATMLSQSSNAQLPPELPWPGSNVGGRNVIVQGGIAVASCGTLVSVDPSQRFSVGMWNVDGLVPNSGRIDATVPAQFYHHPSWLVSEIGNIFGVAVNERTGDIFFSASSNYGAGFFGQASILGYGNIGGGPNNLAAAGTVYRADAVTGQATVFAVLPQQISTFTHLDCEGSATQTRTTGVGLGNIHYDVLHNQYFVTNIEDGRIYRLDSNGNILDSYDPGVQDDGEPGVSSLTDLVVGVAVEPDGERLFFGGLSTTNSVPLWSIDLTPSGGFVGTISNNPPSGATWDNYIGIETFHTSILTGKFGDQFHHHISDLEFTSDSKLLAGVRVGCVNWATSYNHTGESNEITSVAGLYNIVNALNVSHIAPVLHNTYGGVADYEHDESVDYVISSADILVEAGPHGLAVFPSIAAGAPVEPLAAISYGAVDNGDPKGVGGSVDVFNQTIDCIFESDNILCDLDSMGQPSGNYIVNGLFTNLQDIPGTHFLLPPDAITPVGVELCFGSGDQVLQLPAPLNNGDSFEIGADTSNEEAIIIKNAMPGEEVCFRIVLLGDNGVECCTVEVCFEMPPCDCLQVDRRLDDLGDAFFCLVDPTTGDITLNGSYTFQLTNLFGQDVHHCFLAPLGDNIFTTDFFDLVAINSGPLGQGQSVLLSTNILAINPPGGNVEFLVTIHNEDFSECCTRVHSIFLPSCTSEPAMLLGDINEDGGVNLLDVQPFVDLITNGQFDEKADTNMDGSVNLLDIGPFIDILNP